jgi:hypothetical protein
VQKLKELRLMFDQRIQTPIKSVPWFRWDEEMLNHGKRSSHFHNIPPGSRNPVGIAWIGLDKKGIGIHGTDNPDMIGRSTSHGCIVSRTGM